MKLILITGKKQSGKTSSGDAIQRYLYQIQEGDPTSDYIKTYSFATPLKRYCVDVLGLTENQCNGSDDDKNSNTSILWRNLPFSDAKLAELYIESRHPDKIKTASFFDKSNLVLWLQEDSVCMTAREVMQIFGSNICRKLYNDCFANWAKLQILKDQPKYAFITDARFPNELEIFKDMNPIVIRLQRNTFNSQHISEIALDNFDFSIFPQFISIDNKEMSLEDKNKLVLEKIKDLL